MARATRSTANQDKDKPTEAPATTPRKAASKKRKRTSHAGHDEPASKQLRTDGELKEEGSQEPDETVRSEVIEVELPSSGDKPLPQEVAQNILDILEALDTQGILDRIFPLPTEHDLSSPAESAAGTSTGTQSYSFRALLKDSSKFPLRVLRSAVKHLFPISSHPRSRPSSTVTKQLQFCNHILSLLDQASFYSAPVPLDAESILSQHTAALDLDGEEQKTKPTTPRSVVPSQKQKYALLQRLPTGDYWSSLNSTYPSVNSDDKDLKVLSTGYAELVSILPSASSSAGQSVTLAAYVTHKSYPAYVDRTRQRMASAGSFLDYGLFSSFAPTFEQDGAEIGRGGLGEVLWYKEQRMRARRKQLNITTKPTVLEASSDEVVEAEPVGLTLSGKDKKDDPVAGLDGLLSLEQVASIKATLNSLELENAVQELLNRNAKALLRLEELQADRLSGEDGGSSRPEVGSEEWDIAQGIMQSLSILASLRPRSSEDADTAPLVPTASALRKLHRTLPLGPTEGWYGNLPDGRTTALKDDMTVKAKSGASVPAPVAAIVAPATTTVTATATPTKNAAPAFNNYNYQGYPSTQGYRGGYGTYAPNQTAGYYANYHPASTTAQGGAIATTHSNQQYSTGANTGQSQYPYSGWYNYQTPAATAATTGTSGQAISQTPTPTTTTAAASYSGYYPNAQQPQPQRAVTNTVLSAAGSKAYQGGTWTNGTSSPYIAPTLPPHLRTAVPATSSPGTPQPGVTSTAAYPNYYPNYQATQPAAR